MSAGGQDYEIITVTTSAPAVTFNVRARQLLLYNDGTGGVHWSLNSAATTDDPLHAEADVQPLSILDSGTTGLYTIASTAAGSVTLRAVAIGPAISS